MSEQMVAKDGVQYLSVDDIFAVDDVQFRDLDMRPLGWPGKLRIGTLSAQDLIEWTEANEGAKRTAGLRLLIKSLVNEKGERIGRDTMIEKFKTKSHKAVDTVLKEILDLNGLVVKDGKEKPTDAAKKD
jgi:hypothetical protein